MLVLARKRNESIVVGDAIIVTVVEITDDGVRLGIEGPLETTVDGQKIYPQTEQCSVEDNMLLLGINPTDPDAEWQFRAHMTECELTDEQREKIISGRMRLTDVPL